MKPMNINGFKELDLGDDNRYFIADNTILVNEDTGERHRLFVVVLNLNEAVGGEEFEKTPYACTIHSTIDADSLSAEEKANVERAMCCDAPMINAYDIYSYGYSVPIANCDDYKKTTEEFEDWINAEISSISVLYGFYMDKPVNRIGTDGWNFIHGNITAGLYKNREEK